MKSVLRICRHYIFLACFLIVSVIIINLVIFLIFLFHNTSGQGERIMLSRINYQKVAELLEQNPDGGYGLDGEGYALMREEGVIFSFLIDSDNRVVWDWEKPQEIPDRFSPGDIAVFSKWYLKDYPVVCWRYGEEGLLVFGFPKNSMARYHFYMSLMDINSGIRYIGLFLVFNLALIVSIALLSGYRFYRTLKPVGEGIDALAEGQEVQLKENGIARYLKVKINQTSSILVKQRNALARRDSARTEWIAGVSHDIRTPLSIIMGYADALETDTGLPGQARKKAETIREQSIRISKLVGDLNLTSKLAYHMQPLSIESYIPAVWLRDTVAAMCNSGELPENCALELEADTSLETMHLHGDQGLLTRALLNLLGNSVRHNPDGCQIFVRAYASEKGFCFCVEDDGPGIPEPVQQILMNEKTETSDCAPHVMGLRVVSRIAQAHGGKLWFERDGHCVWVSIYETGEYPVANGAHIL